MKRSTTPGVTCGLKPSGAVWIVGLTPSPAIAARIVATPLVYSARRRSRQSGSNTVSITRRFLNGPYGKALAVTT